MTNSPLKTASLSAMAALLSSCVSSTEVQRPAAEPLLLPSREQPEVAYPSGASGSIDFVPLVNTPPYSSTLSGDHRVAFRNRNDFPVLVAIRSGENGLDFRLAGGGVSTANLPEGEFRYFVVFSVAPNALHRSDRFRLPSDIDLEIELPLWSAIRNTQAPAMREPGSRPATARGQSSGAKARMDAAFRDCREAPHRYAAACDTQRAAAAARMSAWSEVRASPTHHPDLKSKYMSMVAAEDKTFAGCQRALDDWSAAIDRLAAAAEEYKAAEGGRADAVAGAALRAADSQREHHRKSLADYEQTLASWLKQRSLMP